MKHLDTLFPLTVSNSSLSGSCELKFFRLSIQHLKGTVTNGDLLAGGTFAKACEIVRKKYYNEGIDIEEATEDAVAFILSSPDTGHPIKTNERLALTFRRYLKSYPLEDGFRPCKLEDGTHAIEYRFEVDLGIPHPDLPDRTIKYTGLLDMAGEQLHQGKVVRTYVLDEKTTGRVSRVSGTKVVNLEKEADQFRLSSQLIGYAYVMNELGVRVDSALIRRVPILNTHEPAFELEIPITRYMMVMWRKTLQAKVFELVEKYKFYKKTLGSTGAVAQDAFYPSYGGSCTTYNRLCVFSEGCLHERGEEILGMSMEQKVGYMDDKGERVTVPLADYKKQLGV